MNITILTQILEIIKMVAIALAIIYCIFVSVTFLASGGELSDKVKLPWERKETRAERKSRQEEAKQEYFKGLK